jgi:hypothetical protein
MGRRSCDEIHDLKLIDWPCAMGWATGTNIDKLALSLLHFGENGEAGMQLIFALRYVP